MPVAMTRPTRHPSSGVFRLRKVIPESLRDAAERLFGVRREFIENLGTKNEAEARRRAPAALAEIERKLDVCRRNAQKAAQSLSHIQCVAIAGAWRRERLELNEKNPAPAEGWEAERDMLLSYLDYDDDGQPEDYRPTPKDIAEAEAVAAEYGIVADEESLSALAQALWLAKVQLAETMIRRAHGDYGPDAYADRYPDRAVLREITAGFSPGGRPGERAHGASFEDLIRGFCRENGINPDAVPIPEDFDRRRRFAKHFAAFIGHDRAADVTVEDAVRWKEHLLDQGKSLRTVANHLSALSAVWAWGETNKKVQVNPFKGLAKPPKKAKGVRESSQRPYSSDEAAFILEAARKEDRPTLRWVPWVLALTGARLAEIVQARKEDVYHHDGMPFIRIHGEGTAPGEVRSVKNGASVRNVPIHPALVAEGFLEYVSRLPEGSPLFPDCKPDGRYGNRARSATKVLTRWVRERLKIEDEAISPNHSWRHWFIDAARDCIDNIELRNAITGHTDLINESHRYGFGYRAKPERLTETIRLIKPPIPPLGPMHDAENPQRQDIAA